MRHMSFMLTTEAFKSGRKTVTRRLGWRNAKVGHVYMGVKKSQGLKKGEHVVKLHPFEIVGIRDEPLWHMRLEGPGATKLEGLPDLSTDDFIKMFIEHNKKKCPDGEETIVRRIKFKHLKLCPECLYPVAYLGDYCGECLCEDDCAP